MTPFGPSCPWYQDLQRFGPANVKWCEERVCGWINEPANTWSNLLYLALGAWIIRHAAKRSSSAGKAFGVIVIVMGGLSFLYHASNNFLTQCLDFTGMFMMVFFVLATNARRLGWPRRGLAAQYFAALVLGTLALWPLNAAGVPIQLSVAVAGVLIAASEAVARARTEDRGPMGAFFAALATLLAAETCSALDYKRFHCDPTNHWLQGHAAWHILSACAMPMIYLYYADRFDGAWAPEVSAEGRPTRA